MARAITRATSVSDIDDSTIITSLAQCLTADTSVGLNAVHVLNDSAR